MLARSAIRKLRAARGDHGLRGGRYRRPDPEAAFIESMKTCQQKGHEFVVIEATNP
jgi:hypothetical protein